MYVRSITSKLGVSQTSFTLYLQREWQMKAVLDVIYISIRHIYMNVGGKEPSTLPSFYLYYVETIVVMQPHGHLR